MYKQKLIDLLKSDEQVKAAIEKLEFGCRIKNKYGFTDVIVNKDFETLYLKKDYEIIGLPLQERFIRMYCENKNIKFEIKSLDNFFTYIFINNKKICMILNAKDFDNQSEEVYQNIYESLLNLNK